METTSTTAELTAQVRGEELEVEVPEKKDKRTRVTWSWAETYKFVTLVYSDGKNWKKILDKLHSYHMCTKIGQNESDKLRKHFNDLASKKSILNQDFKPLTLTLAANLSDEEKQARRQEHDHKEAERRVQFDHCKSLIPLILQREKLANTEEKKDVMKEEMSAKAEERRAALKQKRESLQSAVDEDTNMKKMWTQVMSTMSTAMETSVLLQKELLELIKKQKTDD